MASSPAVATPAFSSFSAFSPGNAKQAVLEHLAETPRLARVTAASHLEIRPAPETVSWGVPELDALTGGLPRGCLTEITGPASSGRTSVLLAALAAATRRGEICALIDASNSFDPRSAAAAGIELSRLLWVRCTVASQSGQELRQKTVPDGRIASSSRADKPARAVRVREPRPSRQIREFRDGYVTAPTYRGAPDPDGVRSLFRMSSAPQRNTSQPDLFSVQDSNAQALSEEKPRNSRPRAQDPVEQALRATDLLLQSGGFGMVVMDLAGIPVKTARRVPLTTWFRFRRVIEPTPTVLLLVDEHSCAQTCATLGLQLQAQAELSVIGRRSSANSFDDIPTHVNLLEGLPLRAELQRARTERKPAQSVTAFHTKAEWTG